MSKHWDKVRAASLVSVAVLAGYLWHGALNGPDRIGQFLPPQFQAQNPPVIYVPDVPKPAVRTPPSVRGSDGTATRGRVALPDPDAVSRPAPAARPASRPAAPAAPQASPRPAAPTATPKPAPRPTAPAAPKPKPRPVPKPSPKPLPKPAPAPAPAPSPGPAATPAPSPQPTPQPVPQPNPPAAKPPAPTVPPVQPGPVPASPTAQEPPREQRPGWGHGDENHDHTGPPGQAKDKENGNDKEKGKRK